MAEYIENCAVDVHPITVAAVIMVESEGDPLAISAFIKPKDRGVLPVIKSEKITSSVDAAIKAKKLIRKGYSVSMGLMKINDFNARAHGYSIDEIFDPCINIEVGTRILAGNYKNARRVTKDPVGRLDAMLSAYKSGKLRYNHVGYGYAARVKKAASLIKNPEDVIKLNDDGGISYIEAEDVAQTTSFENVITKPLKVVTDLIAPVFDDPVEVAAVVKPNNTQVRGADLGGGHYVGDGHDHSLTPLPNFSAANIPAPVNGKKRKRPKIEHIHEHTGHETDEHFEFFCSAGCLFHGTNSPNGGVDDSLL